MGGIKVYQAALKCVVNEDLKEEWEQYLEETEKHVQVLHDACLQLELDPQQQSPGRKITRDMGVAKNMTGAQGKALKEAYEEVEDEEDEHLYHSKGWLRELSLEGLGMKAQLPPPEEEKHVKSAIGQARAEQQRKSR